MKLMQSLRAQTPRPSAGTFGPTSFWMDILSPLASALALGLAFGLAAGAGAKGCFDYAAFVYCSTVLLDQALLNTPLLLQNLRFSLSRNGVGQDLDHKRVPSAGIVLCDIATMFAPLHNHIRLQVAGGHQQPKENVGLDPKWDLALGIRHARLPKHEKGGVVLSATPRDRPHSWMP